MTSDRADSGDTLDEPSDRPEEGTPSHGRGVAVRAVLPSLLGLVVAAAVLSVLSETGSLGASDDALVAMGFDSERARLITALVSGAMAAALVAAMAGRTWVAVVASWGAVVAVFGSTFGGETAAALGSGEAQGTFDTGGWLLTLASLLMAAGIVGWASATLTAASARYAIRGTREAAAALQRPVQPRRFLRAGSVVLGLALLAVTLPVFSDMINYAPDARMRRGAPLTGGLAGPPAQAGVPRSASPPSGDGGRYPAESGPAGSAAPSSASSPLPAGLVEGPLAGSLVTPGALSSARPWAGNAPSGRGQVSRFEMPGPWTGGLSAVAVVDVYLPPGYVSTSTRYPVLYELPWGIDSWQRGAGFATQLDTLITNGVIPPMLVVFASTSGGPYVDSECADSFDGRERFDTYVATQLVTYVDSRYRTIAKPAARGLIGSSQGGYCAAALWSHHPDVFGSAVSFSGYFVAGVSSPGTRNAALPFGSNAAYESRQSPLSAVALIAPTAASSSFVELSGDLNESFYGPQLRAFAAALHDAGVPMAILPTPLGHSWHAARDQLQAVLLMLGARMAELGAFR